MIFLTSPGKTYSVNSIGGCTISAGGTTLATIPAGIQTTFIAPDEEVIVSDNNAIIVEVTGVGAGGSGGSADGSVTDEYLKEAQIYLPGTIPSEMVSGRVYDLGVLSSDQDLSTISFVYAPGYVQTCEIWMETGDIGYAVTWPAESVWPDEPDAASPSIVLPENTRYRFVVRNEGNGTMVITKAYEYSL